MSQAAKTSPRTRKETTKAALEAAAERILTAEGLPAVAYRRIAEEVGCSLGTAFNLLGTSDELVFRINAATLDEIRRSAIGGLEAAGASPADRFEALARAYVDYALGNEPRWRALFDFAPTSPEPEAYALAKVELFRVIEGAVAELPGAASGASTTARALWSAIHGVVIVGVNGNRGLMAREEVLPAAVFLARSLSAGIAAQAA